MSITADQLVVAVSSRALFDLEKEHQLFEKEGYEKDYLLIDGQWRDHVLTALTTPDWTPGR